MTTDTDAKNAWRYWRQYAKPIADIVDPAALTDIKSVETMADIVIEAMHEYDPQALHTHLTLIARHYPEQAAQVMMLIAAWCPPTEGIRTRTERLDRIYDARSA